MPGVPAVNGALSQIKRSAKLQDALTWGSRSVKKAGITRYSSMPSKTGYHRHHIFEKRLKTAFKGATDSNMFSILIKVDDHKKVTNAIRARLPHGTTYTDASYVRRQLSEAYNDLYRQTNDTTYAFLREFVLKARPF